MIDASDSEMQKRLEKGEIIADTVGFMLAGYETTSTALTFATYLLDTNPEAQERLANDIHELFEENSVSKRNALLHYIFSLQLACPVRVLLSLSSIQDKSMYNASHDLQYLDMVIEETLRMYPPAAMSADRINV